MKPYFVFDITIYLMLEYYFLPHKLIGITSEKTLTSSTLCPKS